MKQDDIYGILLKKQQQQQNKKKKSGTKVMMPLFGGELKIQYCSFYGVTFVCVMLIFLAK